MMGYMGTNGIEQLRRRAARIASRESRKKLKESRQGVKLSHNKEKRKNLSQAELAEIRRRVKRERYRRMIWRVSSALFLAYIVFFWLDDIIDGVFYLMDYEYRQIDK